jgi:hypothetical protein
MGRGQYGDRDDNGLNGIILYEYFKVTAGGFFYIAKDTGLVINIDIISDRFLGYIIAGRHILKSECDTGITNGDENKNDYFADDCRFF